MTTDELHSIADRHLDLWFADGPYVPHKHTPTLRDRVCDAMRDALKIRDKQWEDGNATLRHERDAALEKLKAMTQARDDAVEAAHLIRQNSMPINPQSGLDIPCSS